MARKRNPSAIISGRTDMVSSRFHEVHRQNMWSQHCTKESHFLGKTVPWAAAAAAANAKTGAPAPAQAAASAGGASTAMTRTVYPRDCSLAHAQAQRPFLQAHSHSIRNRGSSMLCCAARGVAHSGAVSVTERICNPAILAQGRRPTTASDVRSDNAAVVRRDHSQKPTEANKHVGHPFIGRWAAVTTPTQLVHDVATADGSLLNCRRADAESADTFAESRVSNVNIWAPAPWQRPPKGKLVPSGLGTYVQASATSGRGFGCEQRFRLCTDIERSKPRIVDRCASRD